MNNEFREDTYRINKFLIVSYSIVIFLLVNILTIYVFLFNFRENIIKETTINIQKYNDIDLSHLCEMFECTYIQNNHILFKNVNSSLDNKPVELVRSNDKIQNRMYIFDDMYLTDKLDVLIEMNLTTMKNYEGFVVVTKRNLLEIIDNIYYVLLSFVITANLILLLFNVLKVRQFRFKENIMLQHEGYYKSMMMLTENIHHELNTPLSIINNKIDKLKYKIDKVITGELKKEQCNVEETANDFEMISASLIQINDLLNRMVPFKEVKHQTNRNLNMVIKTACDIMLVSQHEKFNYEISPCFENFKLNGNFLKNGELTAIILNFIKNSIDANAKNIHFKIKEVKNSKLRFYVIDDGNGIPKEFQSNIFKENASSKSRSRGHGLFINKFILDSSNGEIALRHSSPNGTVFEIGVEIKNTI
jgi:signal transduction histidine kinase